VAATALPDLPVPTAGLVFPEPTALPALKAMTVNRARTARRVKAALRERLVQKAQRALTGRKARQVNPETGNLYTLERTIQSDSFPRYSEGTSSSRTCFV
jgi:hypothetical protein